MVYSFDISEKEFFLLRDYIHQNFGIYFSKDKCSMLRMKLYPRVIALSFSSYSEYLNHVKYHPERKEEIPKMISALVNNETYFFREYKQLQLLMNVVFPELEKRKNKISSVNILSAGCSTGEEVYSLAILCRESGYFNSKIKGLDISRKALMVAENASYKERSFRLTESKYREKYFQHCNSGFKPVNSVRENVTFVEGNIVDEECWKTLGRQDIIFCRNVLIYFSSEKTEEAVNLMHKSLNRGGYLFLGHSEILRTNRDQFEIERHSGTMVFRKK